MDALSLPDIIGMLAARALREEVCATPKPGLVDRYDSGAHTDMNLDTFLKSAHALEPYLTQFANIGVASDCMLFGSVRTALRGGETRRRSHAARDRGSEHA